jgi:8-oxo-dGTP pyrophosphatase MutT (NUDIX family)
VKVGGEQADLLKDITTTVLNDGRARRTHQLYCSRNWTYEELELVTMIQLLISGGLVALIVAVLAISKGSIAEVIWSKLLAPAVSRIKTSRSFLRGVPQELDAGISFLAHLIPEVEILSEWVLPPRGLRHGDIQVFFDRSVHGIRTSVTTETLGLATNRAWGFPSRLRAAAQHLLIAKLRYLKERQSLVRFFNGPVAKLIRFKAVRSIALERELLGLWLQKTTYFTFVCTNETLEDMAQGNRPLEHPVSTGGDTSVRTSDAALSHAREEMYRHLVAQGPAFADGSLHANSLAVNLNIITSDRQLLYVTRSGSVARKPGFFGASVSASMDLSPVRGEGEGMSDLDSNGIPDPFRTAAREAWEELNIRIGPEEVTFLALCRVRSSLQPFLIGESVVNKTWSELLRDSALARDRFEWGEIRTFSLDDMEQTTTGLLDEAEHWGWPARLGIYMTCLRHSPNDALVERLRRALQASL